MENRTIGYQLEQSVPTIRLSQFVFHQFTISKLPVCEFKTEVRCLWKNLSLLLPSDSFIQNHIDSKV
jgi:hypothetical protein